MRRPITAAEPCTIPSLEGLALGLAVVAAPVGLVALGGRVQSPQCGSTRASELDAHGPAARAHASRGEVAPALRELGIALGFLEHPSATSVPEPPRMYPGAAPPVTSVPSLPPQSQPIQGGVTPVTPSPPGGIRAVSPRDLAPSPRHGEPRSRRHHSGR
ncbi:MAG: hypothetical protein HY909_05400 [Deltaproteobacteria bacterium]|nr:hypothetical protein [Deltaproteobacteria bacterium]